MDAQATVVARHIPNPKDILDLNNDIWTNAQPVVIERLWNGQRAPAERHAEVRLCWSEKGLHAMFDCQQHEPLVVSDVPRTDKKSLGLWDRDVVEIFVAPDSANPNVYF